MTKLQAVEIDLPKLGKSIQLNCDDKFENIIQQLIDKEIIPQYRLLFKNNKVTWDKVSLRTSSYTTSQSLKINIQDTNDPDNRQDEQVYIIFDNQKINILDYIRLYVSCHDINLDDFGWSTIIYTFDNIKFMSVQYTEAFLLIGQDNAIFCISIYF